MKPARRYRPLAALYQKDVTYRPFSFRSRVLQPCCCGGRQLAVDLDTRRGLGSCCRPAGVWKHRKSLGAGRYVEQDVKAAASPSSHTDTRGDNDGSQQAEPGSTASCSAAGSIGAVAAPYSLQPAVSHLVITNRRPST